MVRILILGGGFGGLGTALELEKKFKNNPNHVEITLVDKNGYHLFVPDIYEIASAYGLKRDPFAVQLKRTICLPYSDIFHKKNINFIQAEIGEVDLVGQKVKTNGGHTLEYDYLVLALGSETADFNIPGVLDYAHQFKDLNDALFINQKLDDLSRQFERGERKEPFSFLICGGGFTGIELAAELGSCAKVIKERCKFKGRCSNITLFEAGPRIMPFISNKERDLIKKRLTKLGIILMENSPIEEAHNDGVRLKNGQKINGDLVIWTAGIKPNRLLSQIQSLPKGGSGKITVDSNLRLVNFENVFAVGDNTEFIDPKSQHSVPAMAYVASDQGKVVARNIFNILNKKPLKKYKPFFDIWVIPIGGKYALAHLGHGIRFNGFWGWVIRQLIDIRYLLSIFSLNKALEIYWNEVTIFSKND